jgi:hypothetical protein
MVRGGYTTVLANAALQVQFLFGLDRQDHAFIRANARRASSAATLPAVASITSHCRAGRSL